MTGKEAIYIVSELIDYAGVAIIAAGAAGGILLYLRDLFQRQMRNEEAYTNLRRFLGRSLLLGLEFLVAGDIIKTVAIEPTMDSVLVLALIVLVRTVLSLSLDVEIDGRWPWDTEKLKLRQSALARESGSGEGSDITE